MKQTKKTYKELALEFKNTKCEKAFSDLYNKMRPGLWNYVYKIVKDVDVADDITSTTLTTVYLKIEQYNPDYQITTWAYRIAFNASIGHIRVNNKKVSMNAFTDKGIETDESGMLPFQHSNKSNESEYSTIEEEHLEKERILTNRFNLTIEAIKSLPPMYKGYMVERFINKKPYSDILDIMIKKERDINLQTVKNRIFRGRKIIQKQLEDSKSFQLA